MSLLCKITKPGNTTQIDLVKASNSNRVKGLLKQNTIPITLHNNSLTFRDTVKEFELKGDLLKTMTNKIYNVDLASLSDRKILFNFAKEMNFDVKAMGNKPTRDRTLLKMPKSPGFLISASGSSNTLFLPSEPDEVCGRSNFLLQAKQAGTISDIIKGEIVVIPDKLLDYKCITKKQQKQILIKGDLLHTRKK